MDVFRLQKNGNCNRCTFWEIILKIKSRDLSQWKNNLCRRNAVASHLAHGDKLEIVHRNLMKNHCYRCGCFLNPFMNTVNITIESAASVKVDLLVYNYNGQVVKQTTQRYNNWKIELSVDLSVFKQRILFQKTVVNGKVKNIKCLIKIILLEFAFKIFKKPKSHKIAFSGFFSYND
jgi:hypothetical protein